MITTDEFFNMSDNEVVEYISNTYYMKDVNDACDDFVFEEVCEYDEDEYDELMEDNQQFEIVRDNLGGLDLKRFLWENVIEQCEELDEEYEDEGGEY